MKYLFAFFIFFTKLKQPNKIISCLIIVRGHTVSDNSKSHQSLNILGSGDIIDTTPIKQHISSRHLPAQIQQQKH